MTTALVGYTGFVGSNLLQFYNIDYFYNSKNFNEAKNMSFDTIFFAGIPAVKWYANKYPEEDLQIINNIKEILKTITVKKFILISTIDVYENSESENINYENEREDYDCDWVLNHHYGRNRYLFELFVKNEFKNHHIIRLPALFGKGLKKNVIYDLLNNNLIENIPINSKFQWYDLEWLKDDIDIVINNNIKICNLFTEPLDTREIIDLFNYDKNIFQNKNVIIYNLKTKYSKLFNNNSAIDYIRNSKVVLESIKKYIHYYKLNKSKLCVSNICIKNTSHLQFACILKLFGIQNVQIAPTTLINNWSELNNIDLSVYTDNNINIYSFQSITFTLNDLNIFKDNSFFLKEHIKRVIDCASKNRLKILVFGCPRNRQIIEDNNDNIKNDNIFINFFREIGDYCKDKDITICIEPNSKIYNCNYLNKISEVGEIVKKIDNNNIKMMVDIGNAIMENDDLSEIHMYKDIIYNIDISEKNMKDFGDPHALNYVFINALKMIKYNYNINLEMLINNKEDELCILRKSLNNFVELYSNI